MLASTAIHNNITLHTRLYNNGSRQSNHVIVKIDLFQKFYIKDKTIAPYNHQSLWAEHGIKSFSTILTKHLIGLGQMWSKYLLLAMFAYNTINSPNLANYRPYELFSGRK